MAQYRWERIDNESEYQVQSKLGRRAALQMMGAYGTTLLIAGQGNEAVAADRSVNRLSEWTAQEWKKQIGMAFEITNLSSNVAKVLTLKKVDEMAWSDASDGSRPAYLRPASISLLFVGEMGIPSKSYHLKTGTFDPLAVFLNPICWPGTDNGKIYEVILN